MCMKEKREPNGHFSYPLGNVISIEEYTLGWETLTLVNYKYLENKTGKESIILVISIYLTDVLKQEKREKSYFIVILIT